MQFLQTLKTQMLILAALTLVGLMAQSEEPAAAQQVDAAKSLKERAQKRKYPGGRDEDSLQVQAQLVAPLKGQQTEEPPEPSTDHD